MGIIYSNTSLMARAKRNGVCFDRVLTIGHLELYLSKKQIEHLCNYMHVSSDPSVIAREKYADELFKELFRAKNVLSLDVSSHEACDIIHDMNLPIETSYHRQFDVVIDGGSLEHIFNFPVAIANCMNMVKKGGSLFIFSMANNHMGHGFYQFSPDLFFRVFQAANGYEIRNVILEEHSFPGAELSARTKCYSVADPEIVGGRVGLVSKRPVTIMVHAVRKKIVDIFPNFPIQTDYSRKKKAVDKRVNTQTNIAEDDQVSQVRHAEKVRNIVKKINLSSIPFYIKALIDRYYKCLPKEYRNYDIGRRQIKRFSFSNQRLYKRIYLD